MPCTELEHQQCHDGDRGEITDEHEKVEGLLLPKRRSFSGSFYLLFIWIQAEITEHASAYLRAPLHTVCIAVLVRRAPRAAASFGAHTQTGLYLTVSWLSTPPTMHYQLPDSR